MSITITPIKPAIGAVIDGIDLSDIHEQEFDMIKQALLDYQVIFFRKQNLTPSKQVALAKGFGSLHIHPIFPHILDVPEIIVLDSHQTDLRDNELWHTDVTFSQTPPLGCVLHAIKVPEKGGDTLWASLSAAYDDLDDDTKAKLQSLNAVHDIRLSFPKERFGQTAKDIAKLEQIIKDNPSVIHPVIRTHPESGRQGLFVSEGFTSHIDGMEKNESRELLDKLFAHSIQDKFSLRWQWQAGDVAIWDNRITQHKALFDYGNAHRIMHRATVNGDVPYFKAD
ncbi:taurine dioxygenase [Moraxella nasovis]|uniref:taurine dioxygenase n=1 Tax=Moraxella nasovis TaxID=2904121 RepID=UPI001F623C5E|nr:taurine dioxygenase [Moraxella nasovis]UNU74207.1 taurine dioxygenase [Moraxella nasovis]